MKANLWLLLFFLEFCFQSHGQAATLVSSPGRDSEKQASVSSVSEPSPNPSPSPAISESSGMVTATAEAQAVSEDETESEDKSQEPGKPQFGQSLSFQQLSLGNQSQMNMSTPGTAAASSSPGGVSQAGSTSDTGTSQSSFGNFSGFTGISLSSSQDSSSSKREFKMGNMERVNSPSDSSQSQQ